MNADRIPVYARIALDLAGKIVAGEFNEGQRVSGRSLLAGQYRVSPETIRRSIQLLEDMEIVQSKPASGVVVISRKQAMKYVERFQMITDVHAIKNEIRQILKEKTLLEARLNEMIERLEEKTDRLQNIHPVYPYDVVVPPNSHLLGKTINESKFWQNTGATIIAIQRGEEIINSPGPYALFLENDKLFITGEPGVEKCVESFLSET